MTIGERIRKKRKDLKLTLSDISQKTKLSTGNLSELENNKYAPSVASLLLLSQALNCSIDWLVTGESVWNAKNSVREEVQENNDFYLLSEIEHNIILMFRKLDDRDQEDILDSLKLKYDRSVKKGKSTSLYSTHTNEQEEDNSETDDQDSGIA